MPSSSWQDYEYPYYPKSAYWMAIFALIVIILLATSIFWLKNYFFSLLILGAAALIYTFANKKPKKITFRINENGIEADHSFFPYKNIKSFWIFYHPPEIKEISIKTKALINPEIKIPLGDQDLVQIRHFLLKYLPEEEHEESLLEILLRIIKY